MRLRWRSYIVNEKEIAFEAMWESLQQYNCLQWFRLGTLGALVFQVSLCGAFALIEK